MDDRQKADYVAFCSLIANGGDLSRFYRASAGPDFLLKTYQVLHLHLGSPRPNVILYVFQYTETVLFVTIDTHRHLDAKPPGGGLNLLGRRQFEADVRAKVEAANA